MIDPAHVIVRVQRVPAARFVGVDDRADRHVRADRRDGVAFLAEHERQRATVALAHDDDDLPLAGLFFGEPAINALGGFVLGLDMAAEIGAVDFLFAGAVEWSPCAVRLRSLRAVCAPERRPSCTGNPDRGSVGGRCDPSRRWRRSRWRSR